MSFLDLDTSDAKEYVTVKPGEYQLKIAGLELKDSKNTGGKYLQATLAIICDEPFVKDISHVMMLPTPQDDVKQANNRKLAIQRFKEAFGIDSSPRVDLDAVVGNTGWAILTEEDAKEFGLQNRVKKFVLPK